MSIQHRMQYMFKVVAPAYESVSGVSSLMIWKLRPLVHATSFVLYNNNRQINYNTNILAKAMGRR